VEEIVNQKERLFEGLTDPDRQVAVVNLDDEFTANIMKAASAVPIVTYSMHNTEADVHTLSTKFSIWESTALIQTPQGALKLTTPLIGRSNMYNILACISAALAKRIPLQTIANALQHAEVWCTGLSARFTAALRASASDACTSPRVPVVCLLSKPSIHVHWGTVLVVP
jgi:UDP-N-acetylmuramyl tripeptide synthase